MVATTGYQAGTEANATQISYGVEAVWGTLPTVAFQAIRYQSETLSFPKTRARPSEIPTNREAIAAVTTQQAVSGSISFALSYGTFDDLLSVLLGNDWQAPQTIAGIAADITLTNVDATHATLSSTLTTKYSNISAGQWIRLLGFTNAANNDFYRVTVKTDNSHLTLVKATLGAPVTETPTGTNAQVRAQTIQNGSLFKSLYLQQRFSSSLFLRYPGMYISKGQLSGAVGQFLSGSFDFLGQQEMNSTTDASTGAILAAPTGRVHDPVAGWGGALLAEAPLGAVLSDFSLTIENTSASAEYGMGSSAAQGILPGTLTVTGSFTVYFRDFVLYQRFLNEQSGTLEFITKDAAGNAYIITLLNANIFASVDVKGQGQAVMAAFTIEGNPQAAGGTIQIDKLPAT